MNSQIHGIDKLIIYLNAAKKIIRGMLKKPFLGSSRGMFILGRHVSLSHAKHIYCGKNVKFEDYSEIHGLCRDGLHFGNNVTIGRGTMIRPSSYYGNDLGCGLVIGDNSSIGPHAYVGCSGKIIIGNNVMFGPKCSLFAENHNFDSANKLIKNQGVNQKGIIIGDDCWFGSNVIILDGVNIGNGCVVGAGTLVNKDLENGTVLVDKRNRFEKKR